MPHFKTFSRAARTLVMLVHFPTAAWAETFDTNEPTAGPSAGSSTASESKPPTEPPKKAIKLGWFTEVGTGKVFFTNKLPAIGLESGRNWRLDTGLLINHLGIGVLLDSIIAEAPNAMEQVGRTECEAASSCIPGDFNIMKFGVSGRYTIVQKPVIVHVAVGGGAALWSSPVIDESLQDSFSWDEQEFNSSLGSSATRMFFEAGTHVGLPLADSGVSVLAGSNLTVLTEIGLAVDLSIGLGADL